MGDRAHPDLPGSAADPTGWDTTKVHSSGGGLGGGNDSHAVAFDPNSNVFT